MSQAGKHGSQAMSRVEHLGNGTPTVDSESKTSHWTGLQSSEAMGGQSNHKQERIRVFPILTSGIKRLVPSPKPAPSPPKVS